MLYCIGSNWAYGKGKLIFKTIGHLGGSESTHGILLFPSLIYSLLISQGFVKKGSEVLENPPGPIHASYRLFRGTHINDLPQPAKENVSATSVGSDVPQNVTTSSALLLWLEVELAEACKQI